MNIFIVTFALLVFHVCQAKVYDRCELAKELIQKHGFDRKTIGDWICLVKYESTFNTAAIGGPNWDGSYDHGLFQINDRYWCAPPGPHNECGVTCDALRSDDISAAVKCVRKILSVHGMEAWVAWKNRCRGSNVEEHVSGCSV